MRPDLVVIDAPHFDLSSGPCERWEVALIEAFVSEASVEAFGVCVFNRLPRTNEVKFYSVPKGPTIECVEIDSGPLSTVIVFG